MEEIVIKLPDPTGELPTGIGLGVSFSQDNNYMTVSHANYPYITIYKREGDTFTKQPNPTGGLPTGNGNGVAFSQDNNYMAVAHNTSPFITMYKREGDTFTKQPDPTGGLPTGTGMGVSFSQDNNYMAVVHSTSPYITIYKRNGDTFTKQPDPTGELPTGGSYGVAFSQDNNYMAVSHLNSPFITIYKREGDTFTKQPNPTGGLPASTGNGVSFSQDNNYMAVAHYTSPFITVYKREGDTFTKQPNPTGGLPTGIGYGVEFSQDNNYMAVAHTNYPFITIYKRNGDTFTKQPNPTWGLPTGTGYGVSFSQDNNYIVVSHGNSPFIAIYKRDNRELILVAIIDKESVFNTPATVDIDIAGKEGALVKFDISLNGNIIYEQSDYLPPPISFSHLLNSSQLSYGENQLMINAYNNLTHVEQENFNLIRKQIDSAFVEGVNNYPHTAILEVSPSKVTYIKTPNPDLRLGYVKSAKLILDIVGGAGETGNISIAPITTNWSSENMTTSPNIVTSEAISVQIQNTAGVVELDISELKDNLQDRYGVAIYSSSFSFNFNVIGIEVDYLYEPTRLLRPSVVYSNNVTIGWLPYILPKIGAFEKAILKRNGTPILETTDVGVVSRLDTTIVEGNYTYTLEVHQDSNNGQGNIIEYKIENEASFNYDDTKVEFMVEAVRFISQPAETVEVGAEDFNHTTEVVLDRNRIKLKPLE